MFFIDRRKMCRADTSEAVPILQSCSSLSSFNRVSAFIAPGVSANTIGSQR